MPQGGKVKVEKVRGDREKGGGGEDQSVIALLQVFFYAARIDLQLVALQSVKRKLENFW